MASLKVLNIVPEDRFSGPIKRVTEVGRLLKSDWGVTTVLVMPAGSGDGGQAADRAGLERYRVRLARTPRPGDIGAVLGYAARLPGDVARLARLIRAERPDLIHLNSAFFLAPALAARLIGTPLVWHINDTMPPPRLARVLGRVVKTLAGRVAVAAAAVGRHYGLAEDESTVLYAPVDTAAFGPRRLEPGVKRVSLLANWSRVKGVEYFLEAAKAVALAHPEAEFHLAGAELATQPEYAARVRELLASPELAGRVRHHGFVADVAGFLARMDVHVLSSVSEACPMSVLEGMAAGAPVAATDVGGVRELLEPDGFAPGGVIVPPADARSLALAINGLLDDPEKARAMGQAGKEAAQALFSLENAAQAHHELYTRLTGRRGL